MEQNARIIGSANGCRCFKLRQRTTAKPAETRMGSGKGSPEWWVVNVKPGRVLFELSYPNEQTAREALTRAIHKLPIKARIITREDQF